MSSKATLPSLNVHISFDSQAFFHLVGIRQLQEWTKESLKEKPFSTAKGNIWTETPKSIPLAKIFTKLRWVEIDRKTHRVTYVNLPDITKLLSNPKIAGKGPVRILVIGRIYIITFHMTEINRSQRFLHSFYFTFYLAVQYK